MAETETAVRGGGGRGGEVHRTAARLERVAVEAIRAGARLVVTRDTRQTCRCGRLSLDGALTGFCEGTIKRKPSER